MIFYDVPKYEAQQRKTINQCPNLELIAPIKYFIFFPPLYPIFCGMAKKNLKILTKNIRSNP